VRDAGGYCRPVRICTCDAFFSLVLDCLADQLGVPKEEVGSWTPYPGGAPANVATATSRLGDKTAFLSAIGEDSLGDSFVQLLQGTC